MQNNIIRLAICVVFYIMGAYATTDILRLLKGTEIAVSAPDCYCPICGQKIRLRDQMPIFSYIKNHGMCRNCKSKIPFGDIFFEVFLFVTLSVISLFMDYSWSSYVICFMLYEGMKAGMIIICGKRRHEFGKNLRISLKNNTVIFSLLAVLFLLEKLV